MSKADCDPSQIDPRRIEFASQDGVDRFDAQFGRAYCGRSGTGSCSQVTTRSWSIAKRILIVATISMAVLAVLLFPGWRLPVAFSIGTGVGIERLQHDMDAINRKAIDGQTLSGQEVRFLYDVYYALATGARMLPTMGPTGRLMAHYLDGSCEPLAIEPRVFLDSGRVQDMADVMRATILKDHENGVARRTYCSEPFYMPDWSRPGSSYGLYYGTLCVDVQLNELGSLELAWKAEVPWEWPSYAVLTQRHGRPDAEIVAIPSLRAIVTGNPRARLHLSNGLGHYLSVVGPARAFDAYAVWQESVLAD